MKRQIISFVSLSVCVISLALSGCAKDDQAGEGAEDDPSTTDPTGDEDAEETETGDDDTGKETATAPTTTTDGESAGFVPETDIPGASTCDPWVQDCPEDEKCVAYNSAGDTWDATKCVPINGAGEVGDACTYDGSVSGNDDCGLGYMCYYTDEESVGICVPQCTGSPDDPLCEEGFNCSISNEGSLLLCLYDCDPLLQDCEQEGAGCFWDGSQFNCDPAGDIPTNEPCGYINDCLAGHVCLNAETLPDCVGSACCASFCELSNPACGVEGTECVSFFDEGSEPPGLEDTGICVLPGT